MTTRRETIKREAARLFAVHGYGGASLRDIAAASGVRQPTLYDHFPSKAALLLEVVHGYFDVLVPCLRATPAEGSAATRLATMLRESVEVSTTHRDVFLTTSNNWELIRTDPALSPLVARRDEATAAWRAVLRDGVHDGSLRRMHVPTALAIIASAVAGLVDCRYVEPGDGGALDVDTLVTVVVEGMAPR